MTSLSYRVLSKTPGKEDITHFRRGGRYLERSNVNAQHTRKGWSLNGGSSTPHVVLCVRAGDGNGKLERHRQRRRTRAADARRGIDHLRRPGPGDRADPDCATALTVDVGARTAPAANVTLTVLATGDLDVRQQHHPGQHPGVDGERRRIRGGSVERDDGTVGRYLDGPWRPLGNADLLAAEQLDVRGWYLHDHAELHAHSSLVLSHGQDTLERPHSCCGAPAWRNNAVPQPQQQMSADSRVPSRVAIPLLVAAALFALANSAPAQTRTATLNVTINGFARLTLSSSGVSFPDSNPDLVPQVPGTPGPLAITVKARTTANANLRLSVLASDDLRSGVRTILASNITWTASGAGFVAGTLNRTTAQSVGSWIGSGVRSGSQSLLFRNLWTHPTGTYTLTMTYTLSSP